MSQIDEQDVIYRTKFGKPVLGLFIAKNIDTNTAETFRIGIWFRNDEKMELNIVPFTLRQFREIFCAQFQNGKVDSKIFKDIIFECGLLRSMGDGIFWKKEIGTTIRSFVSKLDQINIA